MPIAVAKPVDLILDRGAIARSRSINRSGKQRRAVEVGADRVMRFLGRAGYGAEDRGVRPPLSQCRHGPIIVVARLLFQRSPINRAAIQTRRRAGFQPRHRQIGSAQLFGETMRSILPNASAGKGFFAAIENSAEESARA